MQSRLAEFCQLVGFHICWLNLLVLSTQFHEFRTLHTWEWNFAACAMIEGRQVQEINQNRCVVSVKYQKSLLHIPSFTSSRIWRHAINNIILSSTVDVHCRPHHDQVGQQQKGTHNNTIYLENLIIWFHLFSCIPVFLITCRPQSPRYCSIRCDTVSLLSGRFFRVTRTSKNLTKFSVTLS